MKFWGLSSGELKRSNPDPAFAASPGGTGIRTCDLLDVDRVLYYRAISPPAQKWALLNPMITFWGGAPGGRFFLAYPGKVTELYKWLIEDCFHITSGSKIDRMNLANNFQPSIKFPHEVSASFFFISRLPH